MFVKNNRAKRFVSRRGKQHRPQNYRKVYAPDRVGLVGFHDRGFVIAKPTEAHAGWLQERTGQLHTKVSGSWTNLTDGLRLSVQLAKKSPEGVLRRIWLLTDGWPNRDVSEIWHVVEEAKRARININTIGFGNQGQYDENLLRQIASRTHRGAFIPVESLRQLSNALVRGGNTGLPNTHQHQSETTILAIDLSGSMMLPMGRKKRVEVVEEAVLHLLHYKQRCFS